MDCLCHSSGSRLQRTHLRGPESRKASVDGDLQTSAKAPSAGGNFPAEAVSRSWRRVGCRGRKLGCRNVLQDSSGKGTAFRGCGKKTPILGGAAPFGCAQGRLFSAATRPCLIRASAPAVCDPGSYQGMASAVPLPVNKNAGFSLWGIFHFPQKTLMRPVLVRFSQQIIVAGRRMVMLPVAYEF